MHCMGSTACHLATLTPLPPLACATGVRFGPDVTEAFLRDNGLRCILRGHEGASTFQLKL